MRKKLRLYQAYTLPLGGKKKEKLKSSSVLNIVRTRSEDFSIKVVQSEALCWEMILQFWAGNPGLDCTLSTVPRNKNIACQLVMTAIFLWMTSLSVSLPLYYERVSNSMLSLSEMLVII